MSVEIGTGGSQSLGLVGGSEAGERGPGNGSACAVSHNCRFGWAHYAHWLLTSACLSSHLLIICGSCTNGAGHSGARLILDRTTKKCSGERIEALSAFAWRRSNQVPERGKPASCARPADSGRWGAIHQPEWVVDCRRTKTSGRHPLQSPRLVAHSFPFVRLAVSECRVRVDVTVNISGFPSRLT